MFYSIQMRSIVTSMILRCYKQIVAAHLTAEQNMTTVIKIFSSVQPSLIAPSTSTGVH